MRKPILLILVGLMAFVPQLAKAQSYGKVFQKCTLKTPSGVTTNFSCRWMWNGVTGGTSFVDNYDTDARYLVGTGPSEWISTSLIGRSAQACIKSKRGAIVCLVN